MNDQTAEESKLLETLKVAKGARLVKHDSQYGHGSILRTHPCGGRLLVASAN